MVSNTAERRSDGFGRLRIVLQNNPRGMLSLFSMWNPGRSDNHTTSNPVHARVSGHRPDGYGLYRRHGYVFDPSLPQPAGTVPLVSWWSSSRQDNRLTSDPSHVGAIGSRRNGYTLYRLDGYVYSPDAAQPANTVPLVSWWNASRQEHFTTADPRWIAPRGTVREGYRALRLEGYIASL